MKFKVTLFTDDPIHGVIPFNETEFDSLSDALDMAIESEAPIYTISQEENDDEEKSD